MSDITIKVDGMTCNHCKSNVEKNIAQISGVESVEANIQENEVYLNGSFDLDLVKEKINGLGYEVKE